MSAISTSNILAFLRKTSQQRRVTARFFVTLWLGKLAYAPHKMHVEVPPQDAVSFWWSHFPGIIGPAANSIFAYRGEDIGELRFLWRYLRAGMTFFDVGSHEGLYSVVAAKKIGPTGHVSAFEPSPRERRRLELHLRLNRLGWVNVVPCAVAATEGQGRLVTVVSGNTGRNSLIAPITTDPLLTLPVRLTTLDQHLTRTHINSVDVVKIDAEGAELQIFQGADRLLGKVRPLIICEVLDISSMPWGYPARDIIGNLRTYDYEWFDILPNGQLLPHCQKNDYPEVKNYLAVPREKLSGLAEFIATESDPALTSDLSLAA